MSLLFYGQAPRRRWDARALKWNVRATITFGVRIAARSAKEAFGIACTIAGPFAIVAAGLALDVWIWVPRLNH